MENATRALLIAGGILLALMIITFGVYVFNYIHEIKTAEATKTEKEQVQQFNQEYEVYNKKIMYGADIVSVFNKIQNNNKYQNHLINFSLILDGGVIEIQNGMLTEESLSINTVIKTDLFKCSAITYGTNGYVNQMRFESI